ncbi:hypothetical protein DH2020_002442 [Rehmannia glutinosa]|uniref:Uncharacterized protein n=1 Tax=Rehmannia glutinosa TaxID=99300 RepID=A0ABR0XUA2_REHGL
MDARNSDSGESSAPPLANWTSVTDDRPGIPQLFPSVPALHEAASYLAETTSIFTRCFPDISLRPVYEDPDGQEMLAFVSGEARATAVNRSVSPSASISSLSESVDTRFDAPVVQGGITRSSSGNSSQSSNVLVQSNNTNQNGVSIFQGLIERVRRTVRGSADDIGWLQRASDLPPVEDGTERFTEILDDIRHGLHGLPNTMVYLLVPGLFSNHGPLYFVNTKTSFSKMGLTCHIAKIHSEASVEKNAKEIKDYIEEIYWGSRKQILLLGHSKGGVDAAASLSMYWDELKDKVAGLALAQSPYGGSPIASDILRAGQLGDYVNIHASLLYLKLLLALEPKELILLPRRFNDEKRKDFLRKHPLPSELLSYLSTPASISPAVLATLSRVAHAELPMFSPLSAGQPTTLPVVIPLGAAMAACAQLLQIRYGEKSDGLVTCRDAEVPDASQVCEALLTLLVEVGQQKRHEIAKKDE